MSLFKQSKTGKAWGYIAQTASQAAVFVTVINFFMLAGTFFVTAGSPFLTAMGFNLPFWLFLLLLVIPILIAGALLFKFAVPSFFSAFNDQFYKHDNPMREDIDNIKEIQKTILEKLNESGTDKPTTKD